MACRSVFLALAGALLLAGCAAQSESARATQQIEQRSPAPSHVYAGWRLFQGKCAGCHGADATGGAGPDLLPRVRGQGPRQFADLLLTRYEWATPPTKTGHPNPEREAWIDDIVQRRTGAIVVPAWQGEPALNAHLIDLYAWLSARAEGTQGPGRPAGP